MMAKTQETPPWMPWSERDFREDPLVVVMTDAEELAYRRLLGWAWDYGGSLPDNSELLARLARTSVDEWERLAPKILKCFRRKHGRLHQKRLTREYEKASKLSRSGKDGAEKRWKRPQNSGRVSTENINTSDGYPLGTQCQPISHPLGTQCQPNATLMPVRVRDRKEILISSLNSTSPASPPGKVQTGAHSAPEVQNPRPRPEAAQSPTAPRSASVDDPGPPRLDPESAARASEMEARVERMVRALIVPRHTERSPAWPELRLVDAAAYEQLDDFEKLLFRRAFERIRGFDFTKSAQSPATSDHPSNGTAATVGASP